MNFSDELLKVPRGGIAPQPAPPPEVPTWVSALSVGDWYEIPNTKLNSLPPGAIGGTSDGKVTGWTGYAADARTSILYSVASGGHASWGGNEVDALNLNTETPNWSEELADSGTDPGGAADYKDNGTPVARHQYYGAWVDEWADRVMLASGSPARGTPIITKTDSWNIGGGYNAAGTHPDCPTGVNGFDAYDVSRCVDPLTGDLYCIRWQTIGRWNRASNTWTASLSATGDSPNQNGAATAAFDSDLREILCIGGGGASKCNYSLSGNTWTTVSFTGDAGDIAAATAGGAYGMFYVPALGAYLLRDDGGTGGGTVYKLLKTSGTTFAVSQFTTAGGATIPYQHELDGQPKNGPYNKFAYMPALGGAVLVTSYAGNAWFLKIH